MLTNLKGHHNLDIVLQFTLLFLQLFSQSTNFTLEIIFFFLEQRLQLTMTHLNSSENIGHHSDIVLHAVTASKFLLSAWSFPI